MGAERAQSFARFRAREPAGGPDGVVVIGVQPGYPASVAGVNRGDVITKVNQQPVETLDVLKRAHTAYEATPEPVLVEVMRNRQISLVVLKP